MAKSKRTYEITYELVRGEEMSANHIVSPVWSSANFHAHEYYEFYFFIQGNVHIVLEEHEYKMEHGDLVIYPPGMLHRAVVENCDLPYERMFMYVTPECMNQLSGPYLDFASVINESVEKGIFHFHVTDDLLHSCIEIMDQAQNVSYYDSPAAKQLKRGLVQSLISYVCQIVTDEKYHVIDPCENMPIEQVIRYVQEHITDEISVDDLADMFFMSKSYLLHKFKERTDVSLHQYIVLKRLILAKGMLVQGMNASTVAEKCGYSDYSCFFKAFKKYVGISPQKYAGTQVKTSITNVEAAT